MRALALLAVSSVLAYCADAGAAAEIRKLYDNALAALRTAQTKDDLKRLVESMDAPEWVGIDYDGTRRTRDEALRNLNGLLQVPPARRPANKLDILWLNAAGPEAVAVTWVYGESEMSAGGQRSRVMAGSLVRDTFRQRPEGWRRIRHEKFFPNRPLMVDGKPVILPQQGSN